VDYSEFLEDLNTKKKEAIEYNKNNLLKKIKIFFSRINYSIDFEELLKLNQEQLVNTVCMISPFSSEEKQKLIETIKTEDKIKLLDEILNFNLVDVQENKTIQ